MPTPPPYAEMHTGLNQIVVKYFRNVAPGSFEVKYGDLISKRGLWNGLTDLQRKNFADDIFSLVSQIQLVLFSPTEGGGGLVGHGGSRHIIGSGDLQWDGLTAPYPIGVAATVAFRVDS